MKRAFATLALVLFLGAIGLLLARTVQALRAPPDLLESKVRHSTRRLYYRVRAADGPRFDLTDAQGPLRLVTHARLPAGAYDPSREIVYGLRLQVVAGGAVVWAQDYWIHTRQSKARVERGIWLDENTFSVEPQVQVSDDRDVWVLPPAALPAGAELHVRLLGTLAEAVVRFYAQRERTAEAKRSRIGQLGPAERETMAERFTYLPWDRLRPEERLGAVRYSANALPAAGLKGVDYEPQALYFTGFRLPPPAGAKDLIVSPARAVALNVVGPAALSVRVAQAGETPAAALEVRAVGEGPRPRPWRLDVPPRGTEAVHALSVPAGLHSLHLSSQGHVRVEVMDAPGGRARFGPPLAHDTRELVPEEVRLPAYVSQPDGAPIVAAIEGPDDAVGRLVRVDVRLIEADRGALTFELVGSAGAVRGRQVVPLRAARAPFEQALLPGPAVRSVAEPIGVRIVAPAGTRQVRLSTTGPALLRLYARSVPSPEQQRLEPPFGEVPLADTSWRYAPVAEGAWVPMLAANHASLLSGRAGRLSAQIRLEARSPAEQTQGVAQTLLPVGQPERQLVIEHVPAENRARALATWGPDDFTPLSPGKPQKVDLSQHRSARPKLSYWVLGARAAALGTPVTVLVDGAPVFAGRFLTTRGSWTLPPLSGVRTVEVRTGAERVRLLLDRPPAGGGELVAVRSVYALAGRRPFSVQVPKRGRSPQNVNLVVYTTDKDPRASLHVALDGGSPRRVEGRALSRWTRAARVLPLPPSDREPTLAFANVAEAKPLWPHRVVVPLGDDIAEGTHTLTVNAPAGMEAWARMFMLTSQELSAPAAFQYSEAEAGDD